MYLYSLFIEPIQSTTFVGNSQYLLQIFAHIYSPWYHMALKVYALLRSIVVDNLHITIEATEVGGMGQGVCLKLFNNHNQ